MSASLAWSGLDDLAKDIAFLPATVRAEFKPRVTRSAERIESRVRSAYAARGVDGSRAPNGPGDNVEDLTQGLRIETNDDPSDISARVINRHPLVHLFEFGSASRTVTSGRPIKVLIDGQWVTVTGANRGRMPAANIFVPIVEEERAALAGELAQGLQSLGSLKTLAVR